jgi:hypothetical protein
MAKMKIIRVIEKNQERKWGKIQAFTLFCNCFRDYFSMGLFHHNFKTYLINIGGGFFTMEEGPR